MHIWDGGKLFLLLFSYITPNRSHLCYRRHWNSSSVEPRAYILPHRCIIQSFLSEESVCSADPYIYIYIIYIYWSIISFVCLSHPKGLHGATNTYLSHIHQAQTPNDHYCHFGQWCTWDGDVVDTDGWSWRILKKWGRWMCLFDSGVPNRKTHTLYRYRWIGYANLYQWDCNYGGWHWPR